MILKISLVIVTSLSISLSLFLLTKLVVMRNQFAELNLRAAILEQSVKNVLENNPTPIESSEGFLRFISESRDWAFQYIESVQEAIKQFSNEIEPSINYFDEYGDVISNQRPDYQAMQKISKAYKELIKMLPEEKQ